MFSRSSFQRLFDACSGSSGNISHWCAWGANSETLQVKTLLALTVLVIDNLANLRREQENRCHIQPS